MGGLFVLFVALLSGCASAVKSPAVAILDVRVASLGLSGGVAQLVLEIENPNRFALQMDALSYEILIGSGSGAVRWDMLAEGTVTDAVSVPGRDSAQVTVDVPFRYSALGTALGAVMQGRAVPYRVEGQVQGRGFGLNRTLAFRSEGALAP
jgi:LEA14-like dessication related protein